MTEGKHARAGQRCQVDELLWFELSLYVRETVTQDQSALSISVMNLNSKAIHGCDNITSQEAFWTDCIFRETTGEHDVLLETHLQCSFEGAKNGASTTFVTIHVFHLPRCFEIVASSVISDAFTNKCDIDLLFSGWITKVVNHDVSRFADSSFSNIPEHIHSKLLELITLQNSAFLDQWMILNLSLIHI